MTVQAQLSRRALEALALVRSALDPRADTTRLDALVEAAAAVTAAEGGQLSMLTDRQITASVSFPLSEVVQSGNETAFEDTMCAKVLMADATLVIKNTAHDSRVSSVPAAVDGYVRAYLGAPLRTSEGAMVGVLCVFDSVPREWTPEQVAAVTRLAGEVMAELTRLESLTEAYLT